MAYNNDYAVNEEQIAAFLSDALKSVEEGSNSDIEALKEIKKLFKKNVPLSRRNYVAAWLIKAATSRGRFVRDRSDRFQGRDRTDRNDRFSGRDKMDRNERFSRDRNERRIDTRVAHEDGEREERPHTPRVQIAPELAKSIFISIGRNRRVYPRDLLGLLGSVAGLDRERIGDIKVLTSYSFVQLYAEDCEKAINALNGYDYRGRKLNVGYSRKAGEGEENSEDTSASSSENFDSSSESASVSSSYQDSAYNTEPIPENVTNTAHADTSVNTEAARIAAAQSEFAARETSVSSGTANDENIKPFFETTDDGQVKSRFGVNG